jgi:hypothetical protein
MNSGQFSKNYNLKLHKIVKIKVLKKLIQNVSFPGLFQIDVLQKKTFLRLQGQDLIQLKKNLNNIKVRGAPSTNAKGPYITDAVASWIKKGFVISPFEKPLF